MPAVIREDIECSYRKYSVSALSLVEIIQLQQINRISLKAKPSDVLRVIEKSYIKVVEADAPILDYFYTLDFPVINGRAHTDPFDRLIVSTAIVTHRTLISSDKKFPIYRDKCGLQLVEI